MLVKSRLDPLAISGDDGQLINGTLVYDDPYSGILTVQEGPGGESFSGRFTVVDKTSTKRSSGNLVVPSGNVIPAMGATNSSESGVVTAEGYWFARGSQGSSMKCELKVGRRGHGKGICNHSGGEVYDIVL
jgi:hypothetical protein